MPKTTAEVARELAKLSSDCSFLLTHLVRQTDGRCDDEGKAILHSILDTANGSRSPLLKSSLVGWYGSANANIYNPVTMRFDGPNNNRAVCFTESTLAGLKAHRDIFGAKYGVSFDRDLLFQHGANPCLNIREALLRESFLVNGEQYERHVYNFIPHQLHAFVNIIHESFDATHEREWRIPSEFSFGLADLMFVFCPARDFPEFSALQRNATPVFFDLAWLDRV